MVEPTGYTALDLIGFTDRGDYKPAATYVKNDLVHYGGSIWKVLIDDTTGQTPQKGIYYDVFVKEPTNMVERIMAPLEQNPATQAWTVGRQIINNDYLYEVIAPIAIGDNLVAYEDDPTNANIKLAPPIETQVLAIKNEADKTEDMIAPAESNPAAASHSVGTQIIVDNILYDVTSPIAADDALIAYPTTGYNIKPAAPVSSQIQALTNETNDIVNVLGAKNLLQNNATSQVTNGITYTVKSDGSVNVNGTASSNADLVLGYGIPVKNWIQKEGEYLLSFGDELQGEPGHEILSGYIAIFDDSKTPKLQFDMWCTRTSPVRTLSITKEIIDSNTTWIQCLIRVWNGNSVSSKTVYPMIRPASIEDDTYVPYAMTNRELTDLLDGEALTFTPNTNANITITHASGYKVGKICSVNFGATHATSFPAGTVLGTFSGISNIRDIIITRSSSVTESKIYNLLLRTNGQLEVYTTTSGIQTISGNITFIMY